MRRPLNLNPHAGRLLALTTALLALGPAVLWLSGQLLLATGHDPRWLLRLARVSVAAGLGLLGLFLLLVLVEQVQDARYDRAYRRQQARKLALPGGGYECQYCGNRQVGAADRRCSVCGRKLA